ncbi:MAG: hypothetical protein WDN04_05230 [Rhodospirillales bacterium]
MHMGAAHHVARLALLDGEVLLPGQTAGVQLVFETPLCSQPGDRFIVRNAQASRTIGGGRVLDPFGVQRARRSLARTRLVGRARDLARAGHAARPAASGALRLAACPGAALELLARRAPGLAARDADHCRRLPKPA